MARFLHVKQLAGADWPHGHYANDSKEEANGAGGAWHTAGGGAEGEDGRWAWRRRGVAVRKRQAGRGLAAPPVKNKPVGRQRTSGKL